ncbi:MAG: tetratricopeptide repeat protein [Planctomycetes bacterium]|nr:tetratricopeptide repeat protein [Planctomycetota bacterium]
MTETTADSAQPLESSPILQGERIAFTGTLASMTHRQAMELVEQHGGQASQHVSHQTTLLIVGEEGWPLEPDGRVSVKLDQARQLHDKGEPVRILSESEWLSLLNVEPQERKQQQLYTPAMLSQLLNISVHEIRRWERVGLIKPAKKVFRLPYFDFQEVTGARRLYELAQSGVKLEELASGLERLKAILPNIDRPLAQLEVLVRGRHLVYRDSAGLIEPSTGQRVFDFDPAPLPEVPSPADEPDTILMRPISSDPSPDGGSANRREWTAGDWFHEGCRLADDNEVDAAIEAFRLALIDDPLNPTHHFHLADVLYRQGHPDAAIERYYMTVELDHNFLEAWTQLGCLLDETGQIRAAQEAFRVALDLHPDYPDAHYHLAELLERTDRHEEAAAHWQSYLKFDQRGPWAEIARQRLGL